MKIQGFHMSFIETSISRGKLVYQAYSWDSLGLCKLLSKNGFGGGEGDGGGCTGPLQKTKIQGTRKVVLPKKITRSPDPE